MMSERVVSALYAMQQALTRAQYVPRQYVEDLLSTAFLVACNQGEPFVWGLNEYGSQYYHVQSCRLAGRNPVKRLSEMLDVPVEWHYWDGEHLEKISQEQASGLFE